MLFALDESKGTDTGYDTLYLDVNGNGDLSDDPKAMAQPNEEGSGRIRFANVATVPLNSLCADSSSINPIRLDFSFSGSNDEIDFGEVVLRGCWCGEVETNKGKIPFRLSDVDLNGCWNDKWPVLHEGGGGDMILFDWTGTGSFENLEESITEWCFLGSAAGIGCDAGYGCNCGTFCKKRGSKKCVANYGSDAVVNCNDRPPEGERHLLRLSWNRCHHIHDFRDGPDSTHQGRESRRARVRGGIYPALCRRSISETREAGLIFPCMICIVCLIRGIVPRRFTLTQAPFSGYTIVASSGVFRGRPTAGHGPLEPGI